MNSTNSKTEEQKSFEEAAAGTPMIAFNMKDGKVIGLPYIALGKITVEASRSVIALDFGIAEVLIRLKVIKQESKEADDLRRSVEALTRGLLQHTVLFVKPGKDVTEISVEWTEEEKESEFAGMAKI